MFTSFYILILYIYIYICYITDGSFRIIELNDYINILVMIILYFGYLIYYASRLNAELTDFNYVLDPPTTC